jgi:hypothetical protein
MQCVFVLIRGNLVQGGFVLYLAEMNIIRNADVYIVGIDLKIRVFYHDFHFSSIAANVNEVLFNVIFESKICFL